MTQVLLWEDIYAGYRYFDTFHKNVLFPFGYGLSYTKFDISEMRIEKVGDGIKGSVMVENTGKFAGKEVIQVYLSKGSGSDLGRPVQELKGFEKTPLLEPGQKKRLCITIPWRELAVYEERKAAWVIGIASVQKYIARRCYIGKEHCGHGMEIRQRL